MQLVAFGAQDVYLTGNPQITFFKIMYRRHTNFALESIEQTFNGNADFGKKVTCAISRNGDMISRVYLRVELPDVTVKPGTAFRWTNWLGHVLVKTVEVEIGGQRIDKHCGDWLNVWNELSQTSGKALGYANMVGHMPELTQLISNPTNATSNIVVPGRILYIPFQFWFCKSSGLALPLIALQYHEVKVNLEMRDVRDCYWSGSYDQTQPIGSQYGTDQTTVGQLSMASCSLYVDYVFLDTEERKKFAQVSHEYLIEQLQYVDESTTIRNPKIKLVFNHPCKELIFVGQRDDVVTDSVANQLLFGKQWFNFTDSPEVIGSAMTKANLNGPGGYTDSATYVDVTGDNCVSNSKLVLNGHDRFSPSRDGRYFNLVQPYQHHTNIPTKGINVYSFALKPEDHQPSGSCNMSRIDTAMLNLELSPSIPLNSVTRIKIYAINYNVLRIMSGMGGLAYSN